MDAVIREIDATPLLNVVSELSRLSGRDYIDILVPQVAAVLKACIRNTPARSVGEIIRRMSARGNRVVFDDGTEIVLWGKAKDAKMFHDTSNFDERQNPRTTTPLTLGGKSWHQMNRADRHWSNERWSRFQAYDAQATVLYRERQKSGIEAKIAARGLAKKTWLQIIDDLGSEYSGTGIPEFVRNARDPKGREFKQGTAIRLIEAAAAVIEITNANPIAEKLGGWRTLQLAIDSREKAFLHDMEHGVFDDFKRRAKRYPGIFTD